MPPDPQETIDAPSMGDPLWSAAPAGVTRQTEERYVDQREIGRGGLGRVVAAHDRVLQRPVAIKELVHASPRGRARFRREILLTARLQHPAIVSLYEVIRGADGEERYAMKLVTGTTLDVAVAQAGDLAGRLGLLRHMIAVADAVAYAHAQGVIHRDIKPANILIGAFGETVLIDWGLAKDLSAPPDPDEDLGDGGPEDGAGLTQVGAVLGTPAYMAPEQARGEPADVRSDVYAIGASLWHLLAGAPPFGTHTATTLSSVRGGEAPGQLGPGVPADLAAIVQRAMAPASADRYPGALELSRDLQRFSTGQLVEARRYSLSDLLRRWVAQHRALVGLTAAAAAALITMGAVATDRVVRERNAATSALALADARSSALILAHADGAAASDATDAMAWLATYPADGADWETAFRIAQEAHARGVARLAVHPAPNSCDEVTYATDGMSLFPTGLPSAPIDAKTGAARGPGARIEMVVPLTEGGAVVIDKIGRLSRMTDDGVFSPIGQIAATPKALASDGSSAMVGDQTGQITAFDLTDGSYRQMFRAPGMVVGLGLRGGRWVAAWDSGEVWAGPVAGGAAVNLLRSAASVTSMALAGDAVIVSDARGEVAELTASGERRLLLKLPLAVAHLSISPDGRFVAAADSGEVRVLDRSTGVSSAPPGSPARAIGLAWSTTGILAITRQDGVVHLWRPGTGDAATLRVGAGSNKAAAFSPDGREVALCGVDGALRVWPVPALSAQRFIGHTGRVFHVAALADGWIASDSEDHTVRLWSTRGVEPLVLRGHTDGVYGLDVSPDGRRLLSAGNDGAAYLWAVGSDAGVALRGHEGRVHRAMFAPDGQTLLTSGRDGTLRAWAPDGRQLRAVQAHTGSSWWLAATGDVAFSAGADRTLQRWRYGSGEPPEVVASDLGPAGSSTLRPYLVGDSVVTCADPRTLLVSSPAGQRRLSFAEDLGCPSFAVSPDGHRVAIPMDTSVGLLDLETDTYTPLLTDRSDIHSLVFSPDGTMLATAGLDGTARVWRVSDGAGAIVWRTAGPVLGVAFTADSRRLVAGGADAVVWTGPLDDVAWVPREPAALYAWIRQQTSVRPAP